jgi:predicted  nucleic acid-binding Zn-ribbon protein
VSVESDESLLRCSTDCFYRNDLDQKARENAEREAKQTSEKDAKAKTERKVREIEEYVTQSTHERADLAKREAKE